MTDLINKIEGTLKNAPFSEEQRQLIKTLASSFTVEQVYWLGGFLAGINTAQSNALPWTSLAGQDAAGPGSMGAASATGKPAITVLYGSRSGHGEEIAETARRMALSQGFNPTLKDMSQYAHEEFSREQNVLLIVSTHGDGIPPLEAEDFYHFIHNGDAPPLTHLNFTVCALGDSSYQLYCQAGKDFDARLEALGGTRVYPRVDCDVDFEDASEAWITGALAAYTEIAPPPTQSQISDGTSHTPAVAYSKKQPFEATLVERILLNGRGSQKETYHFELSLEGSGLDYEPGDALGVYSVNHDHLVARIMDALALDPNQEVETYDGPRELVAALTHLYELSVISIEVLKHYSALCQHDTLNTLLSDSDKLKDYLYGRDILDMLMDFPVTDLDAQTLVALLRKMPARLYSIASSQALHPNEVHLTVSAVRYQLNDRVHHGVCSTFLADKVATHSKVPVYIDKNKGFKLPEDPDTPIIMVGPGTGVAPFRAFIEERSIQGGHKNWLFFGDQHFTTDFLYQIEWQRYAKKDLLRLDVAFSRDQKDKIYVQHRMKEQSKDLYQWIKEGAHFYVCGDEKHMAHDVHQVLIDIFKAEGRMSTEKAEECVKNMQKSKRYQTDVY